MPLSFLRFFLLFSETSCFLFVWALLVGDGVKGVPSVAPPSVVSNPSGPESREEDQSAESSKAGLLRVATGQEEETRAGAKDVRTLLWTAGFRSWVLARKLGGAEVEGQTIGHRGMVCGRRRERDSNTRDNASRQGTTRRSDDDDG